MGSGCLRHGPSWLEPRAAAVKDRRRRPPEAARSILDGREHGGRLVIVGNDDHCMMPSFVVDRRQVVERGVTTARIVEALDEGEHGAAGFRLGLEATAIKELAFEGGEEALAHGVVIGVSNRAHRGAHACLAAAMAELDRGVLRTLIGVMDHRSGSSRQQRHVQSIEHQLPGERGGHRPADDAAAEGVEHDGEIEKACPGGNVGVRKPLQGSKAMPMV